MEAIRYSLIGAQDVRFGTGTFEVTLADGRVIILEAVNAGHISGSTASSTALETVNATMLDVYRARRGLTGLLDFDQADATTTGLTWGYTNGMAGDGTGVIAASTVTLTANATNYVEWDPETGVISVNTSAFSPTDKVPIRKLVTNATAITTNADVRPIWRQNVSLVHGQGYLSWTSTSVITLLPLNGNRIIINGEVQTIGSSGVAFSNAGLTVSTTYYLYAYMNGSTMTLEASVTAHATSATDGIEIKSGDQTRTYLGQVDVDGSGLFGADLRQWFVHAASGATDARTNVTARPLTVEAQTSGTPAASLGVGIQFNAESADEAPAKFGALDFVASAVGAGAEDTHLVVSQRVAGAAQAEKFRFAKLVGSGAVYPVTYVRKTADETVNGSSALQNDDVLLAALVSNEVVTFACFLIIDSGTTPDFKVAFTIPTSATMAWGQAGVASIAADSSLTSSVVTTASGTAVAIGCPGAGTPIGVLLVGTVVNSTNAGNLTLQWAQNTSNASDTKVLANSWLRVERIA